MRERILLPFLAFLLFPIIANAVVVSRVTDFVPNTKAQADQVDAEFDNIISAINGNIDSENIVDGGIATGDLGTAVVTSGKILDGAVIAGKLGTSAVATANVAAKAITNEKMASANMVESVGTGALIFSGTAVGQAATASITTFGRPILAQMVSSGQTSNCNVFFSTSASYISTSSAELSWDWQLNGASDNTGVFNGTAACSSIQHVFRKPAGTYVIKLNFLNVGTASTVCNCKLFLQEL